MIRFLCRAVCIGCRAPVNVWTDGLHETARDMSSSWSPVHLCVNPENRERVDMDYYERLAQESKHPIATATTKLCEHACPRCGDHDVALSTWGRLIDFPSAPDEESWAEAWVGPLQLHVCGAPISEAPQSAPKPIWEAYGH